MVNTPDNLRYTKDHEWVGAIGDCIRVGITDFAQRELGDVVFVELPQAGDRFDATEPFGSVESVKAVSELYMPVSGTIAAVNESLNEDPEQVNTDPYGDGWIIEIRASNTAQLDGLLTAAQYEDYLRQAAEDEVS